MDHLRFTREDALAFEDIVKARFSDQPQVYIQLVDVLKLVSDQGASFEHRMELITTHLGNLFKEHPDLITRFNNTFMPPGYNIEVPEDGTDQHD